jgi:hypothetical protein
MRHFNIAEYILRSMSRFDEGDPLPLAGCVGAEVSGFCAAVLSRLEPLARFLLCVTIE